MAASPWPLGFQRIPAEPWASGPLDPLGQRYAAMSGHRWYANLDLTVEQLNRALRPGAVLVDYSGGTGILAERLLPVRSDAAILIVDASPRFLRVAVERLGADPRVAFRLLHPVPERRRLQRLDEVLGTSLPGGVDAVVSTNAVHLYPDLLDTFSGWFRVLGSGGQVFVQSGDIRNPDAQPGEWLISEVVERTRQLAQEIAAEDPRYQSYRPVLSDPERMARYEALCRKVFLPIRPIAEYRAALAGAGFAVHSTVTRSIEVGVLEWYEASCIYPDLLAWVGGSPRVDGHPPSERAVQDRSDLLRQAFLKLFGERETYQSTWSYLTARR